MTNFKATVLITLYPMSDTSQWPFPVPVYNNSRFQEAITWLLNNNIHIKGKPDYTILFTQTIQLVFTNKIDALAFTLQFGDLITG